MELDAGGDGAAAVPPLVVRVHELQPQEALILTVVAVMVELLVGVVMMGEVAESEVPENEVVQNEGVEGGMLVHEVIAEDVTAEPEVIVGVATVKHLVTNETAEAENELSVDETAGD